MESVPKAKLVMAGQKREDALRPGHDEKRVLFNLLENIENARCIFSQALGPCLQNQIERCFGGATESRQATLFGHLAKPRLTGLRAERQTNLLIERSGRADHR